MKFSQRLLAGLMAVSMGFAATMAVPQRAHAVLGSATGLVPLAVVGGVIAVLGPVTLAGTYLAVTTAPSNGTVAAFAYGGLLGGGAMLIIGLMLLEDGTQSLEFRSVSDAQALDLGLSAEEQSAFNGNREELGAMYQEALLAAQHAVNGGSEAVMDASRASWDESLGNDTVLRSALAKVYRAQLAR
jgi:hypothetical protein